VLRPRRDRPRRRAAEHRDEIASPHTHFPQAHDCRLPHQTRERVVHHSKIDRRMIGLGEQRRIDPL
jgi:hypothetical protein